VDTQTRHALKQDKLRQAAASSASWLGVHRTAVIRWGVILGALLVLGIAFLVYYDMRSQAADTALGAALDVYNAPLAQPGAPAESGTYANSKDRAKAANAKFLDVEKQFGWMPQGTKAHYFAGITDQDLGQNAAAETELKAAAGSMNRNIANLAKLALAGLYRQTSRDAQAIDLYNDLAAKPSETVPATVAQLDLADLYAASGKQAQARAVWAKVKDADKDGAAGSIATQKLAAKQ
jgi:predicted negative regulator of RcsB-dependent stress response